MPGFDLRSYLNRFPEVCKLKFKRTYNLRALEKEYAALAAGSRHLSARDVMKLFDPERTPFAQYWSRPQEKELDALLRREKFVVSDVLKDELGTLERMLGMLHSVGLVSIVLRFTFPSKYALFSTAVINLLQVHRPRAAELYAAYCHELKDWQKHFGLDSVADTDMALWTFQQLASPKLEPAKYEQFLSDFDNDIWIQRRRISQALRPFLKKYGSRELARILVYEDAKLAGKLAGEEYEQLLRRARDKYCPRLPFREKWAKSLLDQMETLGQITPEENVALFEVWLIRNAAVHGSRTPRPEEIEKMLDAIERICLRWERAEGMAVPAIAAEAEQRS